MIKLLGIAEQYNASSGLRRVAANLFDGENRRVSDRITAYGLFVDPPLGRAGMTEAEVRRAGSKHLPRLSVPIITFERLEVAIRSVPPSVDRG